MSIKLKAWHKAAFALSALFISVQSLANEKTPDRWSFAPWELSAGIGWYSIVDQGDGEVLASPFGPNTLMQQHQEKSPVYYLGLKYRFNIDSSIVNAISVGPSFYYQNTKSTGIVSQIGAPPQPYANYTLKNANSYVLMEMLMYVTPRSNWYGIYLLGGIGVNVTGNNYSESPSQFTVPNLPRDTTLVFANKSPTRAAYSAGAGVQFRIWDNLSFDLRYAYLNTIDQEVTSAGLRSPISFSTSSHNIIGGISYRFYIS